MIWPIDNSPRPYAWGSTSAIAELLGRQPSGEPEAELWFGAHPGSPSRLADGRTLDAVLAESGERLPMLLKLLAAGAPLSLQAHPTTEQAREGFARENAAGIPLDAGHRNYRDDSAKPEILVALVDGFEALAGFRPLDEAREVLSGLGLDELTSRLDDLPRLVSSLLGDGDEVDALVARAVRAARDDSAGDAESISRARATVRELAAHYPGDPGILVALLLNRVTLARGEALFIPAGVLHAYLSGLGVELMTASDNVLRGGLTPKHIDVDELVAILDPQPGPPPLLAPARRDTHDVYDPGAGFALSRVTDAAELALAGPALALCTSGEFELKGRASRAHLGRGKASFVSASEGALAITGAGELFLATVGAA